jgi:glycosyltransferase involved in cell wall biosynthesis
MKVLALTRYGRLGASSRVRLYQYETSLRSAGIDVTYRPLLSNAYVEYMQSKKRHWYAVVSGYLNRLSTMLDQSAFDIIWIEKEALPWLPYWLERFFLSSNIPIVLDFDDAVFHYYDKHKNSLVRHTLGEKHAHMIASAKHTVVGSRYLKEYVDNIASENSIYIPSVVDTKLYEAVRRISSHETANNIKIGWIGQRSTSVYLMPYCERFAQIAKDRGTRFISIGCDLTRNGFPYMDYIPWSEHTEVDALSQLDIGIMPLSDGLFERGKCGYKLVQYMAAGLPVIASNIGENRSIVRHGIDGFLVNSLDEWTDAINTLLSDQQLRRRMGSEGRQRAQKKFCLHVSAPRLANIFNDAVHNAS